MGKIISFPNPNDIEIEEMDREQLTAYLRDLERQLADLDTREPADMESEAYEDWADAHEELEDSIDEILDLLDELT